MGSPPHKDQRLDRRRAELATFRPRFFEEDPLFWPIAEAAKAFVDCTSWPAVERIDRALRDAAGLSFELQQSRPARRRRAEAPPRSPAELYDGRIAAGCVPTRFGSWHDLLNALVWATFPATKRALHERQHRLAEERNGPTFTRLPGARTREQDTLALLDEGGIVELGEGGPTLLFGHALFEALVSRQDFIHGSVLRLPRPEPLPREGLGRVAYADREMAQMVASPLHLLDPSELGRRPLDRRLLSEAPSL